MSTDIVEEPTPTEAPPVVLIEEIKEAKPKKDKAEKSETNDEETSSRAPLSPAMKDLRQAEDKTVKEIIEGFGDHTAYKIRVTRKEPQTVKDRATGKVITTGGFLEWVEGQAIDEAWLQDRYGGGKFELYFRKRGQRGGWEYGGQVTVQVAGEPDIRSLPGATPDAPTANGDDPTMTKTVFGVIQDELKRAHDRADREPPKTDNAMVDILREQLRESRAEISAMRAEIREAANRPPPQTTEDKFKDKFLEKMMDGDSARITAIRTQLESEIRMIKEAALENEKRLYDRFERDRQDMRNSHERELAMIRTSHETALSAAKASYETQLTAAKASFDTQKSIQDAENRRLDRDNTELRDDVKELRAKKDKSLVETAKELETVKEALGLGESEDQGWGAKLADMATNPEALAALGKIIRGDTPAPAAAPAAAAPVAKRRVIRDKTDGRKYIIEPDGTRKGPLPERPQAAVAGPPEPPPIDPLILSQMVAMLENAYSNNTDPDMVARTAKPHVSDQTLMLIREVGGVDAFLSKVAKLPGSSPLLSTQAGRNWVRKVGKSLVGDE